MDASSESNEDENILPITIHGPPPPDPAVLPTEIIEKVAIYLALPDCRSLHLNRHWRKSIFPNGRVSAKLVKFVWDNTSISDETGALLKNFLDLLFQAEEWDILDRCILIYTLHLKAFGQEYYYSRFDLVAAARTNHLRRLKWLFANAMSAFRSYFSVGAWARVSARAFVAAASSGSLDAVTYLYKEFVIPTGTEESYSEWVSNAFEMALLNRQTEMALWFHENTRIKDVSKKLEQQEFARRRWPVEVAAAEGYLGLVKFLLSRGYGLPTVAFETARRNGHDKVLEYLETGRFDEEEDLRVS